MNLVLVDVQQDALDRAAAEMQAAGAQVLACRVDVSAADEVEALGAACWSGLVRRTWCSTTPVWAPAA
jgi:glycerol kinase